jgi:RNA polymerase sigma factor (sigma-70 family)
MRINEETTDTIHSIVLAAGRGDAEAFAVLVRRFQDMAVGYSYARLGDIGLAEDVAQEAFLHAYRHIAEVHDPAAFPGWFRAVVHTQCDRLLRRRRVPTAPLDAIRASGDDPALVAEQRAAREEIVAAINALPLHQRSVVALFYMADYSLADIGAFLQIPVATVKTRLYAARKRLHQRMTDQMQDFLHDQRPSRDPQFVDRLAQLFRASEQGNIAVATALLDHEPHLANAAGPVRDRRYVGEVPALHIAVMHDQRDMIDLLLARGANIDEPSAEGMTPLQSAIDLSFVPEYDWQGMAQFLIERGAQVDIFAAMWMDDVERMRAILEADAAAANQRGVDGITPIGTVASLEQARLLLDYGADMFASLPSPELSTPLRLKARFPDAAFRYLLERGGVPLDVFLQCVLGDLDDTLAAIDGDRSLTSATTGDTHVLGSGIALLHLAVQYGHRSVVERLLNYGADPDMRARGAAGHGPSGMAGSTPLHVAAAAGRADLARLLLERGADPNATAGDDYQTPLAIAEALRDDWIERDEVAAVLRSAT